MGLFKQADILFISVIVFVWVFGIFVIGGYVGFALITISIILYPCSLLLIFLYTSYGQKLKQSGCKQSISLILISFVIVIIGTCIVLLPSNVSYLIDYHSTDTGYINYLGANFIELSFYLSILVFSVLAASVIKYIWEDDDIEDVN